jgi:microcystin-dependent protein
MLGDSCSSSTTTSAVRPHRQQVRGDGRDRFALPDLRGLAPNGMEYSICIEGVFPNRS